MSTPHEATLGGGQRVIVDDCLRLADPFESVPTHILAIVVDLNLRVLDCSVLPSWFSEAAARQVIREARDELLLRGHGFHPVVA